MSRHSLPRRRFLYLSGMLAAGATGLAAGGRDALAARPRDAKVTITFSEAEWGSSLTDTIKNKIIPDFQKLHPNIEVKPLFLTDSNAYASQMVSRVAAGNPIEVGSAWGSPVSLAAQGLLEPLDHFMATSPHSKAKNWPAQALADCTWNGQVYALPITASSFAFWYNVDWFAKKGIPTSRDKFPKTWDDLRKLSKEFTYWKNGRLVTAGYVPMRVNEDIDIPPTIYIWSALNGGLIYDPAKKSYTMDSEQNVAMMEYMLSWINDEYRGDMTAVEASGNFGFGPDRQSRPGTFLAGRLAMSVDGSWFLSGVNKKSGMSFHRFNVASFPVGPMGTRTYGGSWPVWLVIPKGARNQEAAFTWMDYISSIGMVPWANITPDLPANKTVPYIVPSTVVQNYGKAFATDVIGFFHHQADIAAPMWSSPVEDFGGTQFRTAVERILHKQQKPKDALAAAQQAAQSRLKQVLAQAKS